MKTVFLYGLGQTVHDWREVIDKAALSDYDCPELIALSGKELKYSAIRAEIEKRYEDTDEPFRICGLSLGAMLALDYTIRHKEKIDSLILLAAQYKSPTILVDIQNLIFRCMPKKTFADTGVSKQDMIQLSHSMRSLDFTSELKKVSCPVAIVCGEKDKVNQKAARQLSILLPQADLHIIPGAGHEINIDAPEAIADILKL